MLAEPASTVLTERFFTTARYLTWARHVPVDQRPPSCPSALLDDRAVPGGPVGELPEDAAAVVGRGDDHFATMRTELAPHAKSRAVRELSVRVREVAAAKA
jgi:hypothetical protein